METLANITGRDITSLKYKLLLSATGQATKSDSEEEAYL